MKKTLTIFFLFIFALPIYSQSHSEKDISNTLLKHTQLISKIYKDSTYHLTKGVEVNELSYLGTNQKQMRIFIYKVDLNTPDISISTTLPNKQLHFSMQPMTKQAEAIHNPFFTILGGVNGDFYNMKTGVPEGVYVTYGLPLKTTHTARTKGFLSIDKQNKVKLIDIADFQTQLPFIQHALSGGDWLVKEGRVIPQQNKDIHPRTAVGITKENQLFLIAVDGRNPEWSNGMSLEELGTFMQTLGTDKALNLDGGGSTTFFINSDNLTNAFSIRNMPSDKSTTERAVSNGLIITKTK